MAFVWSKDSVLKLDDSGGTLRTLTQYVSRVSGLPGTRNLSDVTALGDTGEKSIPTIETTSFSFDGFWDSTATTGPHAVLNGLRTATATATFEYSPEGTAAGKVKISGECWLTSYVVDASVKERITYSAQFKVDGVVTVGTN